MHNQLPEDREHHARAQEQYGKAQVVYSPTSPHIHYCGFMQYSNDCAWETVNHKAPVIFMFCTDDADKGLYVMIQSYYKGASP